MLLPRSLPTPFLHVRSVEAAYEALAASGDQLTVLAGGTDVMVQQQKAEVRPLGLARQDIVPFGVRWLGRQDIVPVVEVGWRRDIVPVNAVLGRG